MDYQQFFQDTLHALKEEGNYRVFTPISRRAGSANHATYQPTKENKKEVVVWCSNDYLGMGSEKTVLEAMHQALNENGAGAGGTRNIAGTNLYHLALEEELARWYDKQSALLFTSGYTANLAALGTLGRKLPQCVYLSDSENHNSMIEGIRHSGARKIIFRHNDPADLEKQLKDLPKAQSKIIVFESVYSMSGDIAPVADFITLAKKYNALTYIDEVHAVGLYGETGSGLCEKLNLRHDVDIIQGTLAKGVGIIGGFIAASKDLTDFIRSFGYAFIFSTSLPPTVAAGALTSIRYLSQNPQLRQKHQHNVRLLYDLMHQANLPVKKTPSHIVPVLIKDPFLCKNISDQLLQVGHYVQPINFPTVPKGEERLRFAPSPLHTRTDMEDLISHLKNFCPPSS